jgi:O-antigen/teichoic acid export membrane protein
MKVIEYFRNLKDSEFFKASLILLILINIANVLNYVFHFTMAVMLGPEYYGVLAVLTNIIYIFSVPSSSIQTVVSKQTTRFNVKNSKGKIKGMFNYLVKEMLIIAMLVFSIFLLASVYLSKFLKIDFWLLALTGLYLFGAFICPIGIGILQGTKKFNAWGWNTIFNSLFKIILAVLLVLVGFKVYGPILGFVLGMGISFILIFPFIKEIINSKEIKEKVRIFYGENLAAFIAILFITLMYTADTIIAKFVFPPALAGKYAVASMIGKMIFFASVALTNAMFPISSEKFVLGNKERTRGILNKTILAMLALSIVALLVLTFMPQLTLKILQLGQYMEISNILAYVGAGFVFLSFLNMLILYKISINELKIRHGFYILGYFLIEILTLVIFSSNLFVFSLGFMLSSLLGLILALMMEVIKWKKY